MVLLIMNISLSPLSTNLYSNEGSTLFQRRNDSIFAGTLLADNGGENS